MAGIYAQTVTATVHVGPSTDEVIERLIAALVERKVVSVPLSAEFTEEEKDIARRAIKSADAIVKANVAIILGRPNDARTALKLASGVSHEAFRYFTAMGDTFYFEQRFDEAVVWYERALQMPSRDQDVTARGNLASALQQCRLGDIDAHLRRAIRLGTETLSLVSAVPLDWAMTQNNLGVAWGELPTGDRGENQRKAIACYEAALTVYTREVRPVDWALAQNNLGVAWGDLPTGDRGENLRKAIACYEAALTVRTRETHPIYWP